MEIIPRQPYSFEATTRRLVSYEKSAYRYRDGVLIRTLRPVNRPLVVEVTWREGEKPALIARVEGSPDERERRELERMLRHMFSLDVDLSDFYRHIRQDPRLAPIIREREGLHFVLEPSLYECLIKTIISQQLHLSFAATLIQRMIELAGDEVEYRGERLPVFPTPEQVARLNVEDLRALQFNRRKAEYVIDISRKIAGGELDLEALHRLDDEAVIKALLPLRGVGRWTAECLMMFGMGRTDLLPAADIGLRNAVRNAYGLDEQPTEEEVRRIGESWAPWRSYATFYLWDWLTSKKNSRSPGDR